MKHLSALFLLQNRGLPFKINTAPPPMPRLRGHYNSLKTKIQQIKLHTG
jgi:hypothetical protein